MAGTASTGRTLDSLESLRQRAAALWSNARGLVQDHTQLALLEVQRAGGRRLAVADYLNSRPDLGRS